MDIYLVLCDPDFIQTLLTVHDKTIQKYEKKKRGKKKKSAFCWRPAQPALCFSPSMSWDRPQPTVTLHRMSGYRECVYGWMNLSSLSVNSAFLQLPYPESISKHCTKSLINPLTHSYITDLHTGGRFEVHYRAQGQFQRYH